MAQTTAFAVDTTALGIIAEEIERSLAATAAALDQWDAHRTDAAALDGARRALVQVRGALEVAGVTGVARVLQELEALFADLAQGRFPSQTDTAGLSRYALDTIRRSLAAQTLGSPQDVGTLAQVLQRLFIARGSDQVAAIELFRPDLSLRPPDPKGGRADEAERLAVLQEARARYQKGLLSWLRLGDRNGLLLMRSSIESVDAACDTASARAPWWVAAGLLDLLLAGALEPSLHVKRMCSALDQWLRRVIDGAGEMPEQLMREMLYFAATSAPATDRATEIRQTYRLEAIPPLKPKEPERAIPFMRQFAPLRALEQALERAAVGDVAALKTFSDGVEDAMRNAPADDRLAELLKEVSRAAAMLGTQTPDACAPLALETATTLLFLQDILSRWSTPDADLHGRIEAATLRLRAACEGRSNAAAPGWSSLFGAARRKAQDSALTGRLIAELLSTLADAEQRLNRYFEDSSASEELTAAQSSLAQAGGALQVAGEQAAAAAAGHCIETIKRHRTEPSTGTADDYARLAAILSGLHYYLEQLRFGPTDFAAIMAKAGVPESIYAGAAPLPHSGDSADAAGRTAADQLSSAAAPPGAASDGNWDVPGDAELWRVFIDEARAVLNDILAALARLHDHQDDTQALTAVHRSFHTLKGGGRMLQLRGLGNAAWEMEQAMNDVLEGGKAADPQLLGLIELAHQQFSDWLAQLQRDGKARIDATGLVARAVRLHSDRSLPQPITHREPRAARDSASLTAERSITIAGSCVSQALFDVFLTEAWQILDSLDAELGAMRANPGANASHELFRLAHTLSGIAGTVRLDAIHHLAGALESVVRSLHEGALSTTPEERDLLARCASALRAMIAQVSDLKAPRPKADLQAQLESMGQRLALQSLQSAQASPEAAAASEFDLSAESSVAFEMPGDARQLPATSLQQPSTPSVERRRERLEDDVDRQMLPVFLEEASDLVPRIGQELHAWRLTPENSLAAQALARLLHTLKGSARMAGAMALGELIHSTETRVLAAAQLAVIPESVFEALEASCDRIGLLLEQLSPSAAGSAPQGHPTTKAAEDTKDGSSEGSSASTTDRPEGAASGGGKGRPRQGVRSKQVPHPAAAQGTQLRVQADLMERLAAEAGEVEIARSRLGSEMRTMRGALRDMAENLARLRTQAREVEIQAESQMQSRLTVAQSAQGAMDPLEFDRFTRLQELTRFITESTNDVFTLQQNLLRHLDNCDATLASQARMTRMLQDALTSVRLVPFSSLSERLFRVVRLAAREAGKRVNLDIRGGGVELDRGVLDRIVAALEHLLRNAVVHGIETGQVRRAAGKAETGEITLEVVQEGNEVVLTVRDDGGGFDIESLRAKAIEAGLMTAERDLSEREIAQFAFATGVSTADRVTEAAGRGVGLDVVRTEVEALGGRVEVAFERAKGTSFMLHLPQVVSVMQVLLVRCGGQLFAVPSAIVEQTRTIDQESLERIRADGHIEWRGRAYPVHELRSLLGLEALASQPRRRVPFVLVKAGAERAAVQVDELSAHQEVVVKNIGAQLARVAGISGAAVLGSGEVVLILNPVRLVQRAAVLGDQPVARSDFAAPLQAPVVATVMVIDDSVTMRKTAARVLSHQGYEVVEARDGIEALSKLEQATPGALLLDIEMPRMDGFELLRRIRGDPRWRNLPVMMITSRTADKHRQYARELGVEVFLGKPFEEQDLLAKLAGLVGAAH